jgi:hypothetical protein
MWGRDSLSETWDSRPPVIRRNKEVCGTREERTVSADVCIWARQRARYFHTEIEIKALNFVFGDFISIEHSSPSI